MHSPPVLLLALLGNHLLLTTAMPSTNTAISVAAEDASTSQLASAATKASSDIAQANFLPPVVTTGGDSSAFGATAPDRYGILVPKGPLQSGARSRYMFDGTFTRNVMQDLAKNNGAITVPNHVTSTVATEAEDIANAADRTSTRIADASPPVAVQDVTNTMDDITLPQSQRSPSIISTSTTTSGLIQEITMPGFQKITTAQELVTAFTDNPDPKRLIAITKEGKLSTAFDTVGKDKLTDASVVILNQKDKTGIAFRFDHDGYVDRARQLKPDETKDFVPEAEENLTTGQKVGLGVVATVGTGILLDNAFSRNSTGNTTKSG